MMSENLTPEQAEIFQFARSGHNILVTGQAGTGKSRVVNVIRDDCRQRGLKVAVICSSGIACQVYDRGVASTVHSYYGLGAADMPSGQLIDRATSNVGVSEKLKTVDVVIWDEASMSSARMLELVNALHHRLCEDESEEERLPFAGKQIIIVGEFLQLRPVPSLFDSGSFMFLSRVFGYAITHRFQLTKVLRQWDTVNTMFKKCLSDVRLGTCSQETAAFIEKLSRSLDPQLKSVATHIFFKKNSVFLFNRSALEELDGELLRFDATFDGKGEKMKFPGEKTLFLKHDCKVMLVWNRSDALKNGSMGRFKSVDGNKLLVYFEKVGTVGIERVTWIQRNRQGEKIGSVSQFPIILGNAVTCHKSQGLELPAVVLHSSKEFVPGLVYVAMSRVRSADTLQVLAFNINQILPADPEVILQCSRDVGECDASLRCCRRRMAADETFFDVRDRFQPEDLDDVSEDGYQFPIDVSDGMVRAYFELEDTNTGVSIAQIYQQMESHESELSRPPPGLDMRELLLKLKVETTYSDFSQNVNEAVDVLLDARFSDNVKAFIDIMWFHSFCALEAHIFDNSDDLDVKVSRCDFTTATAKLQKLLVSPEFDQYILCLFNASSITSAERSVACDIGTALYMKFLDHLLALSTKEANEEAIAFDVEDMPAAGKAKVRHVGGWAIRKVLEKSRRYVRANMYSENAQTMASVRQHHSISELIEESLVGSVTILENESKYKDTLQVTEARQYRERGLIHIEDAVYKFFMALENERVKLLNDQTMRREGADMVEVALQTITDNRELKVKWRECFNVEDQEEKKASVF